jgi:CRP-like cAMP-binding protein
MAQAARTHLARKLAHFADLSDEDVRLLDGLASSPTHYHADRDVICQGDRPSNVHLVVGGFACRYKLLEDGRRQIVALLLPGDLCDPHIFLFEEMDHSIATLAPSGIAMIPRDRILEITEERPKLARALWWSTLLDEAILREWLVNMGQRDAHESMAHLLVELYFRYRVIGETEDDSFFFPLTQTEFGDTLGLSIVHVNRTLQRLRAEGLIEVRSQTVTVLDLEGLKAVAQFDPAYLHWKNRKAA